MTAITEKGKPGYYDDFIKQIMVRVAAVGPGIQQKVKVEDVLKLVWDPACRLLTGKEDPEAEDKEEEEYKRLDIKWTFKLEDLIEEVKNLVSKCFNSISDSHENLRQTFQHAAKLTPKILAPGLGLLLKALASGSMIIEDARVYKAVKEAQMVRRDHEAAKVTMQEMSPIKCIRAGQKAGMLPNSKHKLLRDHPEKDALAKIAATAYVLIRCGMKEENLEVKIKKIGEEFRMMEGCNGQTL